MSDNLRPYRAIRDALTQGTQASQPVGWPDTWPPWPPSSAASWPAGAAQLPKVASHVPDGTKPESRVKRLARSVG